MAYEEPAERIPVPEGALVFAPRNEGSIGFVWAAPEEEIQMWAWSQGQAITPMPVMFHPEGIEFHRKPFVLRCEHFLGLPVPVEGAEIDDIHRGDKLVVKEAREDELAVGGLTYEISPIMYGGPWTLPAGTMLEVLTWPGGPKLDEDIGRRRDDARLDLFAKEVEAILGERARNESLVAEGVANPAYLERTERLKSLLTYLKEQGHHE